MSLCYCSPHAGRYRPLQSKNKKWVLGIGILGSLGIGYWNFGLVGYWVLRFEIDSNTHRLGPTQSTEGKIFVLYVVEV